MTFAMVSTFTKHLDTLKKSCHPKVTAFEKRSAII
jgi:hypothetical protein